MTFTRKLAYILCALLIAVGVAATATPASAHSKNDNPGQTSQNSPSSDDSSDDTESDNSSDDNSQDNEQGDDNNEQGDDNGQDDSSDDNGEDSEDVHAEHGNNTTISNAKVKLVARSFGDSGKLNRNPAKSLFFASKVCLQAKNGTLPAQFTEQTPAVVAACDKLKTDLQTSRDAAKVAFDADKAAFTAAVAAWKAVQASNAKDSQAYIDGKAAFKAAVQTVRTQVKADEQTFFLSVQQDTTAFWTTVSDTLGISLQQLNKVYKKAHVHGQNGKKDVWKNSSAVNTPSVHGNKWHN